jgi:hypothetical protein
MASETPSKVPEHRHIDFHPNQLKLIRQEIQNALKEEARKELVRQRTR